MKKIIAVIIVVAAMLSLTRDDSIVIPSDALRFRVVANSDSAMDQNVKKQVKEDLEKDLYIYLKDVENVDIAKKILTKNISLINERIANTLEKNSALYDYNVNLGMNYFPAKEYKGVIYEEGDYDSLVVTLGKGEGENWWCVLFPPFCLLEAEESDVDDVEYQFFAKKLIDKFLK